MAPLHTENEHGEGALDQRADGERDTARSARPAPARAQPAIPGCENEQIRYFNIQALSRPLDMPAPVRRGLAGVLAVAVVIGAIMLFMYYNDVVNAPARDQAALEENLAREVALDLPPLASYMALSDQQIMDELTATGATLYERTPLGTLEAGGFTVIKLADGVSLADAGAFYLAGINNLSAANAVKLLNGSWEFEVGRESGTNLYVSYADFSAGSVEVAVQNAIEAEGLSEAEIADSGIDESGNTYATGSIETEAGTCTWRVSAVPLSDLYHVSGLPKTAYYVGVRFIA